MMLRKESASSAKDADRSRAGPQLRWTDARAAAVSLFERRRGRHLQWLGGLGVQRAQFCKARMRAMKCAENRQPSNRETRRCL
jgi:hypothetical protein